MKNKQSIIKKMVKKSLYEMKIGTEKIRVLIEKWLN